jgi:hypothetical protein
MAHSSRYKFDIGDRVKNRYSSDEGRVSNLTLLADGTLLVTVAIFVAGLFVRDESVRVLPGAIGGPWQVVSKAAAAGANAVESALRPVSNALSVSTQAQGRAIADDIVKATMSNVITERLNVMTHSRLDKAMRGLSPSLEKTSAEAASDALWDRIKDFERKRDSVFKYKGHFDTHLDYLSAPGTVDGQGQWMGGYLGDIVHGRRRATAEVLKQSEVVERILARTKISPELRKAYGSLIPGEVNTAYDLLLHYRASISRMGHADSAVAWREYSAILSRAVRDTDSYQRRKIYAERSSAVIDELHYQHRLALSNVPGAENWADPGRRNEDFQVRGATDYQVGEQAKFAYSVKEHGYQAEPLDVGWIKRIAQEDRRKAMNQRAGLTPRTTGKASAPEQFYKGMRTRVGTVIEYNRVPHVISAIDPKTMRVTMTPVGSDAVLYSKGILNNTEEMASFTRRLAEKGFRKVDTVSSAARELSKRMATVKTVRVHGGLLGNLKGAVDVPIPLLHEYLAGNAPNTEASLFKLLTGKEMASATSMPAGTMGTWKSQVSRLQEIQRNYLHQEMRRLGIRSLTELKENAGRYGHRFRNLVGIPYETIGQTRKLVENGDIIGAAHLQAGLHLRQVRGGMTMGELSQNLAGRVRRDILDAVRTMNGPSVQAFSQVSKTMKDGEVLAGVEAIDRMGAANIFQAATESAGRSRMLQAEFEYRLRRQAVNAGKGPLNIFRRIFRDYLPGQDDLMVPSLGRYVQGEELAEKATKLGAALQAGQREEPHVIGGLQELAERLNIELVEGTPDLRKAYRLQEKARRLYGEKSSQFIRASRQLQQLENAHFSALDANRTIIEDVVTDIGEQWSLLKHRYEPTSRASRRGGFAIEEANRTKIASILNPLIEAGEAGDFTFLHEAGVQYQVGTRGQVGVVLHGRENFQDPYTYYRTGEAAGYARNRRGHVIPFGMDQVTLDEAEVYDAVLKGRISTPRQEGALFTEAQFRLKNAAITNQVVEAQIKEQALDRSRRVLPLLETEDGLRLGFQDVGPINAKSVLQRTRELAREQGRMIGLDIETDIHTGQVLNVHAQHYEIQGGKAVRTGERLDLALPEFFAQGDQWAAIKDPVRQEQLREAKVRGVREAMERGAVTEAHRTITKKGHSVVIDALAQDEQTIIRQTAAYLKKNKETIVGWNIGFDLKELMDSALRLGMTEEFNVLHEAAGSRLADLMLMGQAAKPGAKSYGLEDFFRTLTGKKEVEAHVGSFDTDWAMQLIPELQKEAEAVERRLGTAQQIRLKDTQYVWDRERRRAYQVAGVLDPRKAADLYRAETGQDIPSAVGLALQPIDFTTGKAEGPLEFRAAKTPHGFGGSFFARHDLLENKAAMEARMQAHTEDYARRRVRRFFDPLSEKAAERAAKRTKDLLYEGGFTQLMLEEERMKLLDPLARGELGQTQWGLLEQTAHGESAASRELARRTHQWSLSQLEDSRIVRQLQLEQPFFAGEIQGAHKPVVDWLKEHVHSAGQEGLRETTDQANQIWDAYTRQAAEIEKFHQIRGVEIPLSQRKMSLDIDFLKDKTAISVGSEERAGRDVQNLVQRIAKKLDRNRPQELEGLLHGASAQDLVDFRRRLRAGKDILDTNLGPVVEQHIHENYILPAVRRGQFSIAGGEQIAPIQAGSMAEAIPKIVSQGQVSAQALIEQMPDNLTPRAFADRGALEALQQRFVGQSVADAHRQVTSADNLVFDLRHGIEPWTGKSARSVVQEGMGLAEEAQGDFTKTLRYAARNMSRVERQQLTNVLLQHKPSWIDTVMHIGETPAGPAGKAVRAFDSGLGHQLGIQLSEKIVENKAVLQKLGIGAALLGGGLLAIRAFSGPGQPALNPDDPAKPNGTASTEAEVERRHQRLLRQQLLTHKVKVNVSAEDTEGVDHQGITDSIHQALGGFFGRQIAHQADVTDHRRKITPDYLDRVAHHLFTSQKRPGAPPPA